MSDGLSVEAEHRQGAFHLSVEFVAARGVTALFGPSGSGKTTVVDVIGGLLRPRSGRVSVGTATLVDTARGIMLPPHRRRIGYVFQEARLFPHLSVRQNLLFGRWFAPSREPGLDLGAVVDLLGIGHILARRPAGLSGGERQRVAIGRALLAKPRLLLMDEPLAALDDARKGEILPFLERLRDVADVPIVYVSHSMPEVVRLANTLVVLDAGRVVAAGPLSEVLARVDVPGLAGTRDTGAVLDGRIVAHDAAFGLSTFSTPIGPILVPILDAPIGTRRRIQIGARDLMLSLRQPQDVSALNVFAATVLEVARECADGTTVLVRLDCRGTPLLARITRKSLADLGLSSGTEVYAVVKSVAFGSGPAMEGWHGRHAPE